MPRAPVWALVKDVVTTTVNKKRRLRIKRTRNKHQKEKKKREDSSHYLRKMSKVREKGCKLER